MSDDVEIIRKKKNPLSSGGRSPGERGKKERIQGSF